MCHGVKSQLNCGIFQLFHGRLDVLLRLYDFLARFGRMCKILFEVMKELFQ